jgi:LytS/YehU family sensor histidine kinase
MENEKEKVRKKIIEMEYMALRAQMNPHFIFNCLNSIQQYIFDKDIFAANKYISRFARLIRTTLQNSSRTLISISDEVEYLSTYLELEKLRFKDQMNYTIEIDGLLESDDFFIPTMILQPYIENSIRHGSDIRWMGKDIFK